MDLGGVELTSCLSFSDRTEGVLLNSRADICLDTVDVPARLVRRIAPIEEAAMAREDNERGTNRGSTLVIVRDSVDAVEQRCTVTLRVGAVLSDQSEGWKLRVERIAIADALHSKTSATRFNPVINQWVSPKRVSAASTLRSVTSSLYPLPTPFFTH